MNKEQEERLNKAFTYQIAVELQRMKVQMVLPGSGLAAAAQGMKIVGQEWRRLRDNCPDYEAGRVNEYKAAFPAAKRTAERLRQEGYTIPAQYMPARPWEHTGRRRARS